MTPLEVRAAAQGDLEALTAIYNDFIVRTAATFDCEPYTVDARRAWLSQFSASGRHRLFVADLDGRLVGYAGSHGFRSRRAYDPTVETTIYVAEQAQRAGIGTRLYSALFDALAHEDVESCIAGITLPNAASVALHERFGFVRCGVMRRVGRKFDRFWDVAWYQRQKDAR